jgi:DNA-binding NarL/FixJ family response regulator
MPPRPRTLNPTMPQALEAVILKAIEKNPARRYQSGQAMAAALLAAMPAAATVGKSTQSVGPVFESDTPAYPVKRGAPLRLVVADDHTLLRRTLINYIAERDDMVVVGEAGDGETALNLTLDQRPNVLLLDLNMPGVSGLEVLPRVRALAPDTRVLVLTGQTEDEYIVQALRRGAQGYILKSSDESELIDSIRKVASGHLVLGEGVAERVVSGMLRIDPGPSSELSELERQILLLVAAGYDNNNISVRLKLPVTRVVEVLAHAMDLLDARDRHAAALLALRKGYISLDELHIL